MKLDLTYHEQIHPMAPAGGKPKAGLLPGLTALTIIGAVGLLSVLPAKASIYPGFGWVEANGTVGAQADNLRKDACNIGSAVTQGVAPVCVMILK
jgi:hypothetical protein